MTFPDRDPDEIPFTCALDVAEHGGATLDDVAVAMNLTRQRVQQIEEEARASFRLREVTELRNTAAVADLTESAWEDMFDE